MMGLDVPTTQPYLTSDVVLTAKVVIARRPSQKSAIEAACTRLLILAESAPEKKWRMKVRRRPDDRWPYQPWAVTAVLR